MKKAPTLSTDVLYNFIKNHRTELRAMPLSQRLSQKLYGKKELSEDVLFEITLELLRAEERATPQQKRIFKNVDNELKIPYQKAKDLHAEGKLSHESFKELYTPKVKENKPSSEIKR